MSNKIDHLTEDPVIYNQLFCCISFLSPEGIRNCKIRGLKVRGVFGTKEEADSHAKKLQSNDPDFHVFVGEVGKWLPWDPEPDSVADQQYREDELQKLMVAYKKNRENVNKVESERKAELLSKANVTTNNKKMETINRLRKKLDQRKTENEPESTEPVNEQLASMEKEIKEQEEVVNYTKSKVSNGASAFDTQENTEEPEDLEAKLQKIRELHSNISNN